MKSLPSPTAERELVRRVLASPQFARSARLSAFLEYVCDRALDGPAEEISEQRIGERVFQRPAGYSCAEDNIVRSHARLLRQRLDAYFEANRESEPVRIVIHKGGYVPTFESNAEAVAEPEVEADRPAPSRRRWLRGAASAVAGGGAAVYWLQQRETPARRMWRAMFEGGRPTLLIPADSALVLAQDLSKQRVTLTEYVSGEYRMKLDPPAGMTRETLQRIARRRYSGVVDVAIAARLVQRPEALGRQPVIRYARDLRFGELKGANVIFVGAPHANPWLTLFEQKMSFWLDLDLEHGEFEVRNRSPRAGEAALLRTLQADPRHPVWAVMAFLPNLDGRGHALILAGASIAGTESAMEFLLNDDALNAFLGKAPASAGRLPHWEVILETATVDGNSPQAKPIAWRFL